MAKRAIIEQIINRYLKELKLTQDDTEAQILTSKMFLDVGQLIRVVNESHRACAKIAELNIISKIKELFLLFQETHLSAERRKEGATTGCEENMDYLSVLAAR
jgi:hypothetical protein